MTSQRIIIHVEGVPVGKGRVRFNGKHCYTPEKTKSYEDAIRWHALRAMVGRKQLDGPVKLTVTASISVPDSWPEERRSAALLGIIWPTSRPDWDNLGKSCSDALNKIVYGDDAQVVISHVTKVYAAHPSMHIEVERVGR